MATSQLAPSKKVTLDVGGRKFVTLQATLSDSNFLASLVKHDTPQPDGSYFVDADPDLFSHILDFLRCEIMPIILTKEKSHDILKYHALQKQAEYFAIEPLANWLKQQNYLKAMRFEVKHSTSTCDPHSIGRSSTSDEEVVVHEITHEYLPTGKRVCAPWDDPNGIATMNAIWRNVDRR